MTIQHVKTNGGADWTGTVTVFNSQGSTVTAEASAIVRPSDWDSAHNQTVVLSGNTDGVSTLSGTNIVFQGGDNVTLSGTGQTVIVSAASGAAGGGITNIRVSAGTTSNLLSALTFADSNGIGFGINASTITASYTVPTQSNQTLGGYALGNTTGESSSSTYDARTLSVRGDGFISVGWSNGSLRISGTQTNPVVSNAIQSVGSATNSGTNVSRFAADDHVHAGVFSMGVSTGGNTAGDTRVDVGRFVLAGGNNVTLSQATGANAVNTISIVGPATAAQSVQTLEIYALGNTTGQSSRSTYDARTLSVEGAGIVSAGWSNSSLRISATQSNQNVTASNGGFAFQTLSFSNLNGMSFGTSAGSAIIASYTRNAASNAIQSVGSATGSGTNTSRFAADDHVHAGVFSVGVSTGGNTAGDTRVDVGRFVFAGGNNVTLSQATGANAVNTISIVGPNTAAQTNQTLGLYAVSNTTGASSSSTFDARTISFHGAGIASVGYSGGSVVISVPAGGGAGDGGVFAGVSTGGNTAGSTGTVSTGNFVLVGSGVISLSQSTGAAGSAATVSILAPATSSLVGTLGISISTAGSTISVRPNAASYIAMPNYQYNSTTLAVGASTSAAFPVELRDLEEVAFYRLAQTVSISSMASIATAANNTKTYNQQGTHNLVLYTRGVGGNSQSLQSVASTSHSSRMSIAVGQNANGSQWTVTHAFTFPATNGSTSFSTSYATTLSNVNVSTTHLTAFTGMKLAGFDFSTTLEAKNYWAMWGFSTADTTNGNASLSNMRVTHSLWGMSQPNNTWGEFGSANNASIQNMYGVGSFTTAGGGTTASLGFSNISSSAAHVVPYLTLGRIA